MSHDQLIAVLRAHQVRHRIFRGQLQAESIYSRPRHGRTVLARHWQTVSGWTTRDLLRWLGY